MSNTHTGDKHAFHVPELAPDRRSNFKDWLTIALAVVGILGFVGQYFVNNYRLAQIEDHQRAQDVRLDKMTDALTKLPGVIDLTTEHNQLLVAQAKAITELQIFRANQEALTTEIRAHMKDTTIHVSVERQQVMIQNAVQPILEHLTKLETQAEDRSAQWDRIEKLLSNTQKQPAGR